MKADEETIQATLDPSGELRLDRVPTLPPGPVSVTLRASASPVPRRGLADVARQIAAEQRSRGCQGRSREELRAEDEDRAADDADRDGKLDSARRQRLPGGD